MFRKENGAIDMVSLIADNDVPITKYQFARRLTVVIAAVTMMVGLEERKCKNLHLIPGYRRSQHGVEHARNHELSSQHIADQRPYQYRNSI